MNCNRQSLSILMHGDRGWTVFKHVRGGDSYMLYQQRKVLYPLHLKENTDTGFMCLCFVNKPESFFIERQLTTEICKMYSFSFIQLIIIFTINFQFGINLNKKCLQITTTGFFKWWMVLYTWKSLNNTGQYQFY